MKNLLLVTALLLSLGSAQAMAGNNDNGGSNGNGYGHCKENGKGHENGNGKGHEMHADTIACIELELNLPKEPNETRNLKTLGGVDSNGNGVPDDVERYNAFTFYPDKKKIAVVDELARLEREIFFVYDDLPAHLERNVNAYAMVVCRRRLLSKDELSSYRLEMMKRDHVRAEINETKDFQVAFDKFEKDHHYELYLHGRVDIDKSEKLCDEFLSKIE